MTNKGTIGIVLLYFALLVCIVTIGFFAATQQSRSAASANTERLEANQGAS